MSNTTYTFTFEPELHLASLDAKSDWHDMNVHTLLQDPSQRQPSINAYLGARYSRSADSIRDIAKEVMKKGADPAKRLETIFQNYGHKSVGDMADLFVCIENVPMFTAMRLFYLNAVIAGQERSTRFQNFKDPVFIKLPQHPKVSDKLREEYEAIIHEHLKNYREMLPEITQAFAEIYGVDAKDKKQQSALNARVFDTVRYFLPLGLQTSLGFVMSARNWSELIATLRGSDFSVEQELGEMLYRLLSGEKLKGKGVKKYLAEASGLIRHTEAETTRPQTHTKLMKTVAQLTPEGLLQDERTLPKHPTRRLLIDHNTHALSNIIRHYLLLNNPLARSGKPTLNTQKWTALGEIIFNNFNHHRQMGSIGQSGSIAIEGMADHGILKDLNRHRSLERFVPLWHHEVNVSNEFNRPIDRCFFVCDYLDHKKLKPQRKDFVRRMRASYERIIAWHKKASKQLPKTMANEYTRYLLPHAHATTYRYYGSPDDLQYVIQLRTRNGGHIAYRNLTYHWLKKLSKQAPFWRPLLDKLPEVDPESKEQFFDRS